MVYTVLKPRSTKADSFGQPCMRTPKTSFEDAEDASSMEGLLHVSDAMPLQNNLQIELFDILVLTSWDHSQSLMTANTSWW